MVGGQGHDEKTRSRVLFDGAPLRKQKAEDTWSVLINHWKIFSGESRVWPKGPSPPFSKIITSVFYGKFAYQLKK